MQRFIIEFLYPIFAQLSVKIEHGVATKWVAMFMLKVLAASTRLWRCYALRTGSGKLRRYHWLQFDRGMIIIELLVSREDVMVVYLHEVAHIRRWWESAYDFCGINRWVDQISKTRSMPMQPWFMLYSNLSRKTENLGGKNFFYETLIKPIEGEAARKESRFQWIEIYISSKFSTLFVTAKWLTTFLKWCSSRKVGNIPYSLPPIN